MKVHDEACMMEIESRDAPVTVHFQGKTYHLYRHRDGRNAVHDHTFRELRHFKEKLETAETDHP